MASNVKQKANDSSFSNFVEFYGKVKIKDVEIFANNIKLLEIKSWIFDLVPRIDLVIMDDGLFSDKFPLEEDDIIEVQLALTKDQEEPVVAEFQLQTYQINNSSPGDLNASMITISGFLKNEQLFNPVRTRAFRDRTSSEVVEEIAEEIGLEPNIKVDSNDVMKWLQIDLTNAEMLRHVTEKSYHRDNDANFCYSEINNEMTYISLKDALDADVKFNASFKPKRVINKSGFFADTTEETDEIPIYYMDYNFLNISGLRNKSHGYGMTLNYYDLDEDVNIEMDSDSHPLTTNSWKTKDNIGLTSKHISRGVQSANVHGNYMKGQLQQEYMKNQFFTSYLMITIKPVLGIRLFDKLFLNLPTQDNQSINNVHSGEYIITNITHTASSEGLYTMTLVLSRNGMNATESLEEEFDTKLN